MVILNNIPFQSYNINYRDYFTKFLSNSSNSYKIIPEYIPLECVRIPTESVKSLGYVNTLTLIKYIVGEENEYFGSPSNECISTNKHRDYNGNIINTYDKLLEMIHYHRKAHCITNVKHSNGLLGCGSYSLFNEHSFNPRYKDYYFYLGIVYKRVPEFLMKIMLDKPIDDPSMFKFFINPDAISSMRKVKSYYKNTLKPLMESNGIEIVESNTINSVFYPKSIKNKRIDSDFFNNLLIEHYKDKETVILEEDDTVNSTEAVPDIYLYREGVVEQIRNTSSYLTVED